MRRRKRYRHRHSAVFLRHVEPPAADLRKPLDYRNSVAHPLVAEIYVNAAAEILAAEHGTFIYDAYLYELPAAGLTVTHGKYRLGLLRGIQQRVLHCVHQRDNGAAAVGVDVQTARFYQRFYAPSALGERSVAAFREILAKLACVYDRFALGAVQHFSVVESILAHR